MSDTGTQSGIWLPAGFTIHHQKAVLKHMEEGRWTLSRTEWRWALNGFNLLHNALIDTPSGWQSFTFLYENQVDTVFADRYLTDLLALSDVANESIPLWARYARIITAIWHKAKWPLRLGEGGRLLLSYWLFWWRSFATGYAFEVQVFRDLEAENIIFTAHDIRNRAERRSFYDLKVLGLIGDIKNSLYFLNIGRSSNLPHDFYITRLRQQGRLRVMVVLMQPAAWKQINGDAIRTTWKALKTTLPKVASLLHRGREVVLIPYDDWKIRVRQEQLKKGGT